MEGGYYFSISAIQQGKKINWIIFPEMQSAKKNLLIILIQCILYK